MHKANLARTFYLPRVMLWALLSVFIHSADLQGQTLPDLSRPFDLGRPVTLPGVGTYLGDLPYQIGLSTIDLFPGTLSGETIKKVGWRGNGVPSWSRGLSAPSVSFEGLLYPWEPSKVLSWLPLPAQTEFLEFPASAWWGPAAASGLVQWTAVSTKKGRDIRILGWGRQEGRWGISGLIQDGPIFLGGHGRSGGPLRESGLTYGRMAWVSSEDLRLGSGFHGAIGPDGDHWASFFTEADLATGDFQSLQTRPFIQTAQEGPRKIWEVGGETRYLFDLGGILRAQLATGLSTRWTEGPSSIPPQEQGFFQAGLQGDILGNATGDMAVRWDLASTQELLGLLFGFQLPQGELVWQADLAKGHEIGVGEEALEAGLGFRFQSGEHLQVKAKALHEQGNGGHFEGFKGSLHWKMTSTFLGFPKELGIRFEEKTLIDQRGAVQWDSAFLLELVFFGPDRTWTFGRVLSGGACFLEAGSEVELFEGWKVRFQVMNLREVPISWPDTDSPVGVHWLTGLEGQL